MISFCVAFQSLQQQPRSQSERQLSGEFLCEPSNCSTRLVEPAKSKSFNCAVCFSRNYSPSRARLFNDGSPFASAEKRPFDFKAISTTHARARANARAITVAWVDTAFSRDSLATRERLCRFVNLLSRVLIRVVTDRTRFMSGAR